MPFDASFFQGLAGPQRERPRYANPWEGPFSQYLRPPIPRPIDIQPEQRATGWEPMPAAIGQIATGFLKGVRQNRVADLLEQERNREADLNLYKSLVSQALQDPDLTDEGRTAIGNLAHQTLAQHMQYELRDAPKDGIAGFFKNLLIDLSGGPIKTRQQMNLKEQIGELTKLREQHKQGTKYQQIYQDALQKIEQLRAQGAMPSQVQQVVANAMNQVALQAPRYVEVFQQALAPLAQFDPLAEMETQLATTAMRLASDPPPVVPTAAASPEAQAELPPTTFRMPGTPGVGVEVQVPRQVDIQPAPPQVSKERVGTAPPPSPTAWMSPEQQRAMAIAQMLIGEPRGLQVMERLYGKPRYANLHAPGGGEGYQAVMYPGIGVWMKPATLESYPLALQNWETSTGTSGQPRQPIFRAGTYSEQTPEGKIVQREVISVWDEEKQAWVPTTVHPLSGEPQTFGAIAPIVQVPTETGEVLRLTRPQAVGTPPPKTRQQMADEAVGQALRQADQDPILAQELLPKNLPQDVYTRAVEALQDQLRKAPGQQRSWWLGEQFKRKQMREQGQPPPAPSSQSRSQRRPSGQLPSQQFRKR